jgi:hypothetical protein
VNDTPIPGSGSSSRGGFTAEIAAGERLSLEWRRCGQAIVITVEGEIDLLGAEQLHEALIELQITGMVSELAVYASRSDALAGCSGGGPAPRPAPRIC